MSPGDGQTVVAVDVGGTFTDVCVLQRPAGALRVAKVPSTPDPIDGVMAGVRDAGIDLSNTALFCHGTTVATNALITQRLPRTAMVTTDGFRDVIEIRRGTRDDLWDAYKDVAPPPVRRRDRFEVPERVDYSGEVLEPLDEEAARRVAAIIRRRGFDAIAVCFINSYANPANETRMAEILAEELPDMTVSTSSDVLPEIFEHERFSTTVANAALGPLVGSYVRRLGSRLREDGYGGDLLILHSGGGVMTDEAAVRLAARLAGSGIAAGAVAGREVARLCGYENAIGVDMGGTSTDVSLVYGGEARVTHDWYIQYGYPIRFPSIEVLTIGAGGGSLAWIDDAGSLRNGPQSAGADPGPAAYGQGGEEPTNTDANLVLGRLGSTLVGGAMRLDHERAAHAIRTRVADPLGYEVPEAARAIIQVANANMADAVRLISLQRGYDPREFALVVFGGAGPLHGAELARDLGIPTVLIPPNPGTWSALGCLMVDIRHDLSVMHLRVAAGADATEVEARFAELEEQGRALMRAEGVDEAHTTLERSIDMRYLGQWRSMTIEVDAPVESLDAAVARFHTEHERVHNFRRDDTPVEMYRLSVRATGTVDKARLEHHDTAAGRNAAPTPRERRRVLFDNVEGPIETPVYDRSELPAGSELAGPAVIDQLDSTTVIPPGVTARVDEWRNLRLEMPAAS
jgi:N-methylhydantoinase A